MHQKIWFYIVMTILLVLMIYANKISITIDNDEINTSKTETPAAGTYTMHDVLKDKRIMLDAGHGGRDVGAIGANGTYEKELTYQTTEMLKEKLTSLGASVYLTRSKDKFVTLSSRAARSNITDIDVFISIHYNSFPSMPQVTGIGTYFYNEHNKKLAQSIQKEIILATEAQDRGVSFADYLILRQTQRPAVLTELGFISNKSQEALIKTEPYQKKIVAGIIRGLQKYFINELDWDITNISASVMNMNSCLCTSRPTL